MDSISNDNTSSSAQSSSDSSSVRHERAGAAIQITKVSKDRHFDLDLDALSNILLKDSIRDKPVVVVSIAGDLRKGKSFILNFFLRYLQSGCGTTGDWLGDNDSPLQGFSWKSGTHMVTMGIMMWSEPFLLKQADGNEVAILLMDTQGLFDSEHTIKDSAIVFALSVMTSSIQIFNLMHNLQEDNLQALQVFTEYGRLALEESDKKPFQKLVFLLRDWSYPYEHPYGLIGGQGLLDQYLAINNNQPLELQRVRRHIRSCFSQIDCFLMPHPGKKVATNPVFDGRLADIDSEFVEQLKVFVPFILDPKNLIVKEVNGRQVTARELMEYFKAYINVFKSESLPEPKCLLEATAEANNLTALATVKGQYMSAMEQICGGDKPHLNSSVLHIFHQKLRQESIEKFDKTLKMGGNELSLPFRDRLVAELDQLYKHFKAQNDSKNIYRFLRTPLILTIGTVFWFTIHRLCDSLGVVSISQLAFIMGTVFLGLLFAYLMCLRIDIKLTPILIILIVVVMTAIAFLFIYRNQLIVLFLT